MQCKSLQMACKKLNINTIELKKFLTNTKSMNKENVEKIYTY